MHDARGRDCVRVGLLGFVLLAACGAQPSAGTSARVRELVLAGPGATRYTTSAEADEEPTREPLALLARSVNRAGQAHGQTLVYDRRLSRLCTWVAQHAGKDTKLPPHEALETASRHLGLVEPTPHFVVITTDASKHLEDRLSVEVGKLLAEHGYTHFGGTIERRGQLTLYLIALGFRFVELAPVPRVVAAGETITLSGRLTGEHRAPELAVTRPAGDVTRTAVQSETEFTFHTSTDRAGVYRLEVLAQGPRGTAVVANFPVYAGTAPPARIVLASPGPHAEAGREAEALLELVNRDRERAGVRPLVLDPALDEVAHAHVADMLDHGFVAHSSPTTGSAADRVAAAGIRTDLVLENIGRGYSLHEVHEGLSNSPGHRANLLNPRATHVGIGVVAQDEGSQTSYLVTQLFIRVSPKLERGADEALHRRIDERRAAEGQAPTRHDEALRRIAARAATRCMQAPFPSDAELMREVSEELARTADLPAQVSALLMITSGLEDLPSLPAVLDPAVRSLGVGLGQGTRPTGPKNAICAVLLLGQ